MAGGVSNLGSFLFQKDKLSNLRMSLLDAQRQIATGKKSDIYAGLGTRVQEVQRLRADINIMESYNKGIDAASIRGNLMDAALSKSLDIARDISKSISLTPAEGNEPDITTIQTLATSSFDFLKELLNTESNGRYLFAGSNISTPPYADDSELMASVQAEMDAWMNGTQTVDDFLANVNALTGTDLGYSLDLNSATAVKVRVDDGRDVDYTVLANNDGMSNLVRVAAVLSQLEFPDESDPSVFATKQEYYQVLREMKNIIDTSIDGITQSQANLAVARNNMQDSQDRHVQDIAALNNIVASIENVDPAEAIVKLQAIETQLNASYNTIAAIRNLSLVNFL